MNGVVIVCRKGVLINELSYIGLHMITKIFIPVVTQDSVWNGACVPYFVSFIFTLVMCVFVECSGGRRLVQCNFKLPLLFSPAIVQDDSTSLMYPTLNQHP